MSVYYPGSVTCNRDGMQSLYQEPMYLNQQQASSASAATFSDIVNGNGGGGGNCLEIPHASVRNEMVFIPPNGDVTALQGLNANVTANAVSSSDLSFHGLSLSLGTQIPNAVTVPVPPFQYQYQNMSNHLGFGQNHSLSVKETLSCDVSESGKDKEMLLGQPEHMPSSGFSVGFYNNYRYETSGFVSSVLRSRYLKPAQQLLDEVVSVRKDLKQVNKNKNKGQDFNGLSDSKDTEIGSASNGTASNVSESNMKPPELSPSERQDLQSKKSKLLSMVDEVDKRYNQYYHQMEALASSFEMVAGLRAAKPYTSVALNRISRHFRCLRDAIKGQIQIIRGKLGERENSDDQGERIPRLRYLDQRLRQQRALHQQLGMVRPAWRPQRGLPENAVTILRAWLFEHFLHPYPKESEKIMLAKQTGLTKSQVANWFINARVRLWKPMIEEMYKEEFGDSEMNSKSYQENNVSTGQGQDSSHAMSQFKHEDSQSFAGTATNSAFPEPKPDESQQINRSDYDSLMNYNGFNLDDYRYIGLGNQQDSRFSNPHHLHDFVV
ncbi:PREDICTED: BEL1-like homeodomain protein 3 [Tarenaya hassleriana]|uniref:BEL1-like homeodomain protein 3 n=1 Tax=Tarenaya hassleriana TaxID=28532 RepID=UPI00053C999A|nr:PREDICTED: BEL1-like homeodomain protein 3 [Tarenaya hassleriana]XP_010533500.1 PREDICTED: BEL1-like homeodomain protein 3 [Tarenaya hassleriana]XP_010533508.1 PREDICTED: BEL1-like homeodomain protein 3 [Tarenaya hassleriana]